MSITFRASARRSVAAIMMIAAFCASSSLAIRANGADNIRAIPSEYPPNAYPISVNGFHVLDFKTENLVAPQGIDVPHPRFSWKLFSRRMTWRSR